MRPSESFSIVLPLLATVLLGHAEPARAQHPAEAEAVAADSLLELEALERLVLASNPTLEAARGAARAAEARARQAGSLGDPWLEGSLAPPSLSSSAPRVGYGVMLRQELPLFRLGSERSAARFDALAVAADAEEAAQEILRQARWAYAEYAVAIASRRVLEERLFLLEETRHTALNRYSAGLVGAVDPLQAEGALAHVEHERIVLDREQAVARARLNALLHRPADAALPAPAPLPAPEEPEPADSAVAIALRSRPERASSEARVRAREAGVTAAGREGVPDFSASVGYETYMDESDFWPRVGLGLRLPLSFGRIGAAKDEAEAEHTMAIAERAAAEDRIRFEVREAHLRVAEEAHKHDLFEHTWIPVRERTLSAARVGYEAGRDDLLVVLQAEEELAMARLQQLATLAEYHRALADLRRAVGEPPASGATEVEP